MRSTNSLKSSNRRGFTLVELLTVITIIVILAGLTVGTMGFVQRKAAVNKARAQLALLENGLEQYHSDHGVYPEAREIGSNAKGLILYRALFGDGVGDDLLAGTEDDTSLDGQPDPGATVYLSELDPNSNSMQLLEGQSGRAPTRVVDPFGNGWQYRGGSKFKNQMNNPDFDLYSQGPDGKGSMTNPGEDDIKNW